MGCKSWSLTAKPCDSCRAAPAAVFCPDDSAFLCPPCDAEIHGCGSAAPRHARVLVCEVCEQAPAAVTCKADAAVLCPACDGDIHSANPLARRHERLPVVPFLDAAPIPRSSSAGVDDQFSEEEAEAASWLLPHDPNSKLDVGSGSPGYKSPEYPFGETDPYLDLEMVPGKNRSGHGGEKQNSLDGVVPDQGKNEYGSGRCLGSSAVVDGFPAFGSDYPGSTKPFMYNFTSQSISQSVSSSSLDVGVVPDHIAMADISNTFPKNDSAPIPARASGIDREARVLRYREKRKNRKFEKTIRYASRKAYAETRPRIKGRFAKRSEHEFDSLIACVDTSYGVVPTF